METLSVLKGLDQHGNKMTVVPVPGRMTLLWWYPQILSGSKSGGGGCSSCSKGTSNGAAAQSFFGRIKNLGCDVVGVSFADPESHAKLAESLAIDFPILSTDKELAANYGVVKGADESWPSLPRRVAQLINDEGEIVHSFSVNDPLVLLSNVEKFLSKATAPTRVESPVSETVVEKPGFFKRLFHK